MGGLGSVVPNGEPVTMELKFAYAAVRGQCRSCHAPVAWVVTERGKKMPLDWAPVERTESGQGLFAIRLTDDGKIEAIAVTAAWLDDEEPVFTSHFATCPDRDKWRRNG